MVTISNGRTRHEVTIGAFNTIYKGLGFHIVGAKHNREVKKEEKVVENTQVNEVPVETINVPVEEPEEKSWVEDLLEKPISQWSKEETANFAKEKEIDTSHARKLSEAKDIIKEWLDEQSK